MGKNKKKINASGEDVEVFLLSSKSMMTGDMTAWFTLEKTGVFYVCRRRRGYTIVMYNFFFLLKNFFTE